MAEDGMVATLKRGRSSTEVIQQFNSVNAKILAALLVVTMLCYHGILKVTDGNFGNYQHLHSGFRAHLSSFIQVLIPASGC